MTNGIFQITFPQSKAAADVALLVEWSADLSNWFSGAGYVQSVNVTDVVTNRIYVVQPATGVVTNKAGFFRLRATRL